MPITPITPSGSNAPNDLPSDAAGAVAVPNTLPSDAAGAVAVPNTLPADGAGSVASPVSLPSVAAAAAPRSLTPMVNLDFAAKSYARKGRTVLFDDLLTYTRPSSATFINRRPDVDGGYEYFLDTDYVGSVTNLLTYSEQFDNAAWYNTSSTFSVNAAIAPDGTSTAEKVIPNSIASTQYYLNNPVTVTSGSTVTLTVNAKKGGYEWVYLYEPSTGGAYFNLSAGQIGFISAGVIPSIIKSVDGWFKLSITCTVPSTSAGCRIYIAKGDGYSNLTHTGDGTSGVYLWGAQLTQSAKVLPYVKTLDVAVTKTFTETLRVEYDAATGENLGALIEGAGTNLALYSEQFDNAAWIKTHSVISNTAIAPDGTFSADKLVDDTSTGSHRILTSISVPVSTNSLTTYSFYAKAAEITEIKLTDNDVGAGIVVNLLNGEIISGTGDVKSIGDGWYKISHSKVSSNGTGRVVVLLSINGSQSYTGTNAGAYIWGAQLEAKPFASSYIRTEGSAVSRSSDNLSLPTSTLLKNLPITVNAKFDTYQGTTPATQRHLFRNDGTVPRIRAYIETSGSSITTSAGSDAVSFGITDGLFNGELTIVGTDFTLATYNNKTLVQSKANTTPWRSDLTGVTYIGGNGGGQHIFGHISKFKTYAQALTAQEITLL